ncbi:uncharacterized protein LOC103674926 isoform X5 [Ursus maritimus]|uniref:Uncharacterized protein LOC103674926 isoform X5 n=1 Tax=Ursus maritimus TaxID=29073 RepID=A0A8M1FS45_URSMA|nr:uncharacterized protein LOC103674926 isoform X5 [Ursus maritimus]
MKEKPMNGRESSKSPSRSAPALLPSPPPLPILLKELLEEEKINAGRAKGQDAQGRAALLTYLWGSQMAETVRCPSSRGPAVATTVNSPDEHFSCVGHTAAEVNASAHEKGLAQWQANKEPIF